jgi:hypothetical protein
VHRSPAQHHSAHDTKTVLPIAGIVP